MVRKIYFYALIFFLFIFTSKTYATEIDNILQANHQVAPAIVGISVKDLNTGSTIYQKNQNTLVHPASTLKIITSAAAFDFLGENYQFKTILYKNGYKTYLKLGADPLFSYEDMINLVSQYKNKNLSTPQKFLVDDTIIDNIPYGTGWQWDDNANVFFPQMSPYIINRNLFMVKATVDEKKNINLENAKEYSEPIINKLKYGETTEITRERNIFSPKQENILKGTINNTEIIYIPAKNPEKLYKNVLMYAFLVNQIPISSSFTYEKVPLFSSKEAIISHDIVDVMKRINTNSDNLAAETLIKHAGSVKVDGTGTTENGLSVVKDFYKNNNINIDNIIMVDGSGASMNDYVTADFMTNSLIAISKNKNFQTIKSTMTDTNSGSFQGRLPELAGRLKVKTGTLANTSAVVGYIKSQSGKDLVFAIMLDNLPNNVKPKELENQIIKTISRY